MQTLSADPSFPHLVVMGVSGCGKSSMGRALAAALSMDFIEGDDLHPAQNIAKMSRGVALADDDRWGWLAAISARLNSAQTPQIASCSALKRRYRDALRQKTGRRLVFVYLSADRDLVGTRMAARSDHFMPGSLLDSQFEALETPACDERHIEIDASASLDAMVTQALSLLAVELETAAASA